MMTRRLNVHLLAATMAVTILASSTHVRADDDEQPAARTAGYKAEVAMEGSSAASFATLGLLTAVVVGVMFKNANRSHLD